MIDFLETQTPFFKKESGRMIVQEIERFRFKLIMIPTKLHPS
jgi:hypothetical protein